MILKVNGNTLKVNLADNAATQALLERLKEGAKHWHGATKDSWFQHLATHVHVGDPESNEWLEPVSDEQYEEANTISKPNIK